jgi:hypothetical protein
MRAAVQKEGEKVYEVGAAGFWLQQRRVRFA